MLRHKRNIHNDEHVEEESEEGEIEDTDSEVEDNADNQEDTVSVLESDQNSDDEEDPWTEIIEQTFQECQSQFENKVTELMDSDDIDLQKARSVAYKMLRPVYRKAIVKNFVDKMAWYDSIKRATIYKAIKETVKRLTDEEDYGLDEAWKYGASKRKYLFDNVLKQYDPPAMDDDDDDLKQ